MDRQKTRVALLVSMLVLSASVLKPQALRAQQPSGSPAPAAGPAPGDQSGQSSIESAPTEAMASVTATLPSTATAAPSEILTRDEQILLLLNRFTFGPRPGDLEHVRAIGISKWLTEQFNPKAISEAALDQRLADYPAMLLPVNRLMEQYPDNQMVRAAMEGRAGVPRGEGERAIYDAQMDRLKKRSSKTADKQADGGPAAADPLPDTPAAILNLPLKERYALLCKLSPAQLRALRQQLSAAERAQLVADFSAHQLETLAAVQNPENVVAAEIVQTRILRDLYSERQLQEVMVDFWLNHFNVYMRKSQQAPYFITAFERETIRPRALGHFANLLIATAVSPAMLNYLDNASSVGPHAPSVTFDGRFRQAQQNRVGLNENYARELMELHTLGVSGGYTQHDVTEVAKVFTGWTLNKGYGNDGAPPIYPGFDPAKHEPGTKTVLGTTIKQDGPAEGMRVLHMLASSPQTAHFVCTKLAVRFVSDTPPPALITRMTAAWLRTDGDVRQVLLAMMQSPEFFTRTTYRAKVKTPQDYVLSAIRASGADVQSAGALGAVIAELGMPLYGMQTPQGYSMKADAWNNTAALVSRMNFALALATDRVTGVHANWPALVGSPEADPGLKMDALRTDTLLEDKLLHVRVSDRTRETILRQVAGTAEQQRATLRQIGAKNGGRDSLSNLRLAQDASAPVADPQTALTAGLLLGHQSFSTGRISFAEPGGARAGSAGRRHGRSAVPGGWPRRRSAWLAGWPPGG